MRSVTAILMCAALALPAYAADKPGNAPMTRLHIDSGTLYTKSGIPIKLTRADARIANGLKAAGGGNQKGGASNPDNDIVFLDTGIVSLSDDSLSKLLQSKVKDKGVEDLKVTTDKGQIKISGKMKKLIAVPMTIEGPATATPDGKIEMRTKEMKTAKLPIKGLADALGMNVSKVVGDSKGVKSEGDTIIFDPDELWGLPIHGFVTQVVVQQNGIVLHFGAPQRKNTRLAAAKR
jgi:hypothetical protein